MWLPVVVVVAVGVHGQQGDCQRHVTSRRDADRAGIRHRAGVIYHHTGVSCQRQRHGTAVAVVAAADDHAADNTHQQAITSI